MNFQDLLNGVYTETNRPDLVAQTIQSLRATTLETHSLDFFYKDAATVQLTFDEALYIQQVPLPSLPRFRRLWYARKNNPQLALYQQNPQLIPPFTSNGQFPVGFSQAMGFLRVVDPNDILDDYGSEKLDVCYAAGRSIWIKTGTPLQYAFLGFFQYPNIDVTTDDSGNYINYSSWIADERPYALIYGAASKVFQQIGMLDASRMYDRQANQADPMDVGGLVQMERRQLIADNLTLGDN